MLYIYSVRCCDLLKAVYCKGVCHTSPWFIILWHTKTKTNFIWIVLHVDVMLSIPVWCQNYYVSPHGTDGGECDNMKWIFGEHTTLWICYRRVSTSTILANGVWNILGATDLWGCYCELHPGKVGPFGSFPKENLQGSDAGNLQELVLYR